MFIIKTMELTEIQLTNIKKIKDAYKRGYYVKGSDVTQLFNEVFDKNLNNTNCSACIKNRANELIRIYNKYLAEQEAKAATVEEVVEENNIPVEEPRRKAGRPKKIKE